jgi:hypothetical protein
MTRITDPAFRLRDQYTPPSLPTSPKKCRIAIDEFVDLQIGIALPVSAQGQTEWTGRADCRHQSAASSPRRGRSWGCSSDDAHVSEADALA